MVRAFLPLFFTHEGRESVRAARLVLQENKERMLKGKMNSTIRNAQVVTRRDFLQKLGCGIGAVTGSGGIVAGISSLLQENKKEGTPIQTIERFAEIADSLEKLGLAEVRWKHPPDGPRNPLFIVSSSHENFDRTAEDEEHIEMIYKELHILLHLYDQGMRDFGMEGMGANTHVLPMRLMRKDGAQRALYPSTADGFSAEQLLQTQDYVRCSPQEVRKYMNDKQAFGKLIRLASSKKKGLREAQNFRACLGDDVVVRGLENPTRIDDIDAFAKNVHHPKMQKFAPLLAAVRRALIQKGNEVSIPMQVEVDGQGRITHIIVAEETFVYEEALKMLRWHQTAASDPFHQAREEYLLEKLDAQVVHIGSAHLRNFEAREKPSRSMGIVYLPGQREAMQASRSLIEQTLSQVENLHTLIPKHLQKRK